MDMHYKPRPIAVDASASRDWAILDCKERNEYEKQNTRYKVVACRGTAVVK